MAKQYEIETERNDITEKEILAFLKQEYPKKKMKKRIIDGNVIIMNKAYFYVKIAISRSTLTLSIGNILFAFIIPSVIVPPIGIAIIAWGIYENTQTKILIEEVKEKIERNYSKSSAERKRENEQRKRIFQKSKKATVGSNNPQEEVKHVFTVSSKRKPNNGINITTPIRDKTNRHI